MMERLDILCEINKLQNEIEKLKDEVRHAKSDNEVLKDTIVKLAIYVVGAGE